MKGQIREGWVYAQEVYIGLVILAKEKWNPSQWNGADLLMR